MSRTALQAAQQGTIKNALEGTTSPALTTLKIYIIQDKLVGPEPSMLQNTKSQDNRYLDVQVLAYQTGQPINWVEAVPIYTPSRYLLRSRMIHKQY